MKDDKDFFLASVKKDGYALRFASERLKDDKDIVLKAVKYDGFVLQFAS